MIRLYTVKTYVTHTRVRRNTGNGIPIHLVRAHTRMRLPLINAQRFWFTAELSLGTPYKLSLDLLEVVFGFASMRFALVTINKRNIE